MQELAKRLRDGDDAAIDEIRQLPNHEAAQLLELLHTTPTAYTHAATALLNRIGKQNKRQNSNRPETTTQTP